LCGLYLTRLDSLREHLRHHPFAGQHHTCPACKQIFLGMPGYIRHCKTQCGAKAEPAKSGAEEATLQRMNKVS
jgi:uncharacterized C2H2 Zn-finger protein